MRARVGGRDGASEDAAADDRGGRGGGDAVARNSLPSAPVAAPDDFRGGHRSRRARSLVRDAAQFIVEVGHVSSLPAAGRSDGCGGVAQIGDRKSVG
jgi:hypothetical protein